MSALIWSAGVATALVAVIELNSWRVYRQVLRMESRAGVPHEWPTFRAWDQAVQKRAWADWKKAMGFDR